MHGSGARRRHGQRILRVVHCLLNSVERQSAIASHEFRAAIHHQLRGVDFACLEAARVIALACAVKRRREWIGPAEMIPVIDVLADDDQVGSGNGLLLVQRFQQAIGGRTTGAAFGGEQLEKNRNAGRGSGIDVGRGSRQTRQKSQAKGGSDETRLLHSDVSSRGADGKLPAIIAESVELELEHLMAEYQQSDARAANLLVETLSPQMFRFFLGQVRNRALAEDLLQDFWLRIHSARHTYRPDAPVLPWMYAIARRVRIDQYRKNRRVANYELQVDAVPDATAPETREAGNLDFRKLLGTLPESQREVVLMLKVSGLSLEEVARATRSSVGSVKQKAHRAYVKLRALLEGSGVAI